MSDTDLNEYWMKFFRDAHISNSERTIYVQNFVEKRIKPNALRQLNENRLERLGVTVFGDQLSILEQARRNIANEEAVAVPISPEIGHDD